MKIQRPTEKQLRALIRLKSVLGFLRENPNMRFTRADCHRCPVAKLVKRSHPRFQAGADIFQVELALEKADGAVLTRVSPPASTQRFMRWFDEGTHGLADVVTGKSILRQWRKRHE